MDYLDRLARFVEATRLPALPASAIAAGKYVLLDTLGTIVAGSALDENRRLAGFAAARAPHGEVTLLGHGERTDAYWAALTNATARVALEVVPARGTPFRSRSRSRRSPSGGSL
jgi:2-methylcitrate dehydratase PrpD